LNDIDFRLIARRRATRGNTTDLTPSRDSGLRAFVSIKAIPPPPASHRIRAGRLLCTGDPVVQSSVNARDILTHKPKAEIGHVEVLFVGPPRFHDALRRMQANSLEDVSDFVDQHISQCPMKTVLRTYRMDAIL
jgi:hypothetical protein